MERVTREQFIQIKSWMYRNARPLELARWKYHFENGSREDVINALKAYQNDDGGFGNAIEPDSWNPNSSPYSTSIAIEVLEEIHFTDKSHPMIKSILKYLEDTCGALSQYWQPLIESNKDYPHAPWWIISDNTENIFGYTPTAKLAGFILRFGDKDSEIYAKAEMIVREIINKYLYGTTADGKPYKEVDREGEAGCLYYLIRCLEGENRYDLGNISELKIELKKQVDIFITRNPDKWKEYSRKPSIYINSPESLFFEGNEEIINIELNYILDNRNKDGVWNIVWSWGAYEREFSISENWWKGNIVIWNMLLLRNFGRLLVE